MVLKQVGLRLACQLLARECIRHFNGLLRLCEEQKLAKKKALARKFKSIVNIEDCDAFF